MSLSTAQVISVAIGPDRLRVAAGGLDGQIIDEIGSPTPSSYEELLDTVDREVRLLKRKRRAKTRGVGVCVPGLVDMIDGRVIESPNVPVLNGRQVANDLRDRAKLPCTLVETMSARCFAERIRGQTVDIDDFAIVNYRGGLGLAGVVSRKIRRTVSVDQLIDILRESPERIAAEVDRALDYLAIGVGAVINLFNPRTVFLCGRFLEAREELQGRLVERVRRSSLKQLARNSTTEQFVDDNQANALRDRPRCKGFRL